MLCSCVVSAYWVVEFNPHIKFNKPTFILVPICLCSKFNLIEFRVVDLGGINVNN
ncbi:hypothetical protein Patl1_30492 [Pistacia atlantica]|uniref:Uncharacterized protein n=1 Tax=Pistacia atlantica TaxID=434234 RepID=A0ACC1ABX9_9ROSI|nr:hypothetical protein Patl1_30492 [Pistacia atlantica]